MIPDAFFVAELEQGAVHLVGRAPKVDHEALANRIELCLPARRIILVGDACKIVFSEHQAVGGVRAGGIDRVVGVVGVRAWPDKAVTVLEFGPLDAQAGSLSGRGNPGVTRFQPIEKDLVGIRILTLRPVSELSTGEGGGAVIGSPSRVVQQRGRNQFRVSRGGKHLLAQIDVHHRRGYRPDDLHHIRPKEGEFPRGNLRSEVFHQNPAFPVVGRELRESGGFLIPEGAPDIGHLG